MSTRNENSYREKGRALFLAVMMVLSVVAMSAAFAGAAAATNAYDEDGPSYDGDDSAGGIDDVWIGQEIEFTNVNADGIEIYQGLNEDGTDESPVTTLRVSGDEATLDSEELEEGEPYSIVSDGSDDWHETSFWALSEELDVDFDRNSVYEEDDVTVEFESERTTQFVNVSANDLDEEDLELLFDDGDDAIDEIHTASENEDVVALEVDLADEDDVEFDANFGNTDIEAGEYDFEFNVTDSLSVDNVTIEVTDDDDDIEFVDVASVEEGEIGNITVDVGNADEAAFSFGDLDENHVVNMTLDIDEDEVVFEHNTFEAGAETAGGSNEASGSGEPAGWTVHNATVDDYHIYSELDDGDTLPAETWDLEIGEDTTTDGLFEEDFIDESHDRDLFTIGDRSAPADAVTQTAPHDDDVEDLDDYD
ncbi:surface glycoprotein, partial [Halostagnicola sp. A-GB9-2]|uniref:surface glycoprotein n=1 Tax=Halostagnicola sp. A-GB9-2 TaxID=3048066 RepID=UPI0024BF5A53